MPAVFGGPVRPLYLLPGASHSAAILHRPQGIYFGLRLLTDHQISRYKEHRGPKRRGYDEDYTPDYQGAGRQPDYFSPRPNLTQGSEAVEATVKWFNADKGFGFVTVAGGSDAFLPSRALEAAAIAACLTGLA